MAASAMRSRRASRRAAVSSVWPEGAVSGDGQILGSYLHGMFDTPAACSALLRWAGLDSGHTVDTAALREASLERIADAALPLLAALVHIKR